MPEVSDVPTGRCQIHGKSFVLSDGCSDCLAEKRQGVNTQPETIPGVITMDTEAEALANQTIEQAEASPTMVVKPGENMALIRVKPDLDVSVREIYSEAVRLLDFAQCRVIKTPDDMKDATNDQVIIGDFKKAIEAKRKDYTSPINEHLKAVNAAFQDFASPLNQADQLNRANMNNYRLAQEAIIAEQERINRVRLEAAQAEMKLKGELTESVQVIEVQAPVAKTFRTDMGRSTTVDHWKAEVVDFALLPDEYKLPNQQMLNATARTYKNTRTIPGVRIYNDPDFRTTGRKVE